MMCPNCGEPMTTARHEPTLRVYDCGCGWRVTEVGREPGAPAPKRRMTFAQAAAERRH